MWIEKIELSGWRSFSHESPVVAASFRSDPRIHAQVRAITPGCKHEIARFFVIAGCRVARWAVCNVSVLSSPAQRASMRDMHPEIHYQHVLNELSINRKDPCEIIRELISNAYDADAKNIWIAPILEKEGFIFADDGYGVSSSVKVNGVIPWTAFFSIGKGTKTRGESIGYKCQGTKLCFASARFMLISRCKGEPEKQYRYLSIENPKTTLSPKVSISPRVTSDPVAELQEFFAHSNSQTRSIVSRFDADFFRKRLRTGTVIAVQSLEVSDFQRYYGEGDLYPYLNEYIRYHTRQGDMRVLDGVKAGFPKKAVVSFCSTAGYRPDVVVNVLRANEDEEINCGFPYLPVPEGETPKGPKDVSRLRDGTFFARFARVIKYGDKEYCLVLAVDGNRRALNEYQALDRRGPSSRRSGVRLTDQRGAFVCSQGVKICPYNELFEAAEIEAHYDVLASGEAQAHYILMINGDFELVTNRNSLAEGSLKVLRSPEFIRKVREFLDAAAKDPVFGGLVQRLKADSEAHRLDRYLDFLSKQKESLKTRDRMRCSLPFLAGRPLFAPIQGEEHWVAALYCMFSHHVSEDTPLSELWLRPITYSSVSIDSLAVAIDASNVANPVGLEFKWSFAVDSNFSHPFQVTAMIVCWDLDSPDEGDVVCDDFEFAGRVKFDGALDGGLGYYITDIESAVGDHHPGRIAVICLPRLLESSFGMKVTAAKRPKKKAKKAKRKS